MCIRDRFNRIYSINKGLLRILILIIYSLEIGMIAFESDSFRVVDLPIWIFVVILYYFIYWSAIRLLLWIYDGFKKK